MKSKPQTVTECQHPYNGSIFHSPVSLSIVITVIVCLCLGYFVFQVTALEKGKVYERTCVCVCGCLSEWDSQVHGKCNPSASGTNAADNM